MAGLSEWNREYREFETIESLFYEVLSDTLSNVENSDEISNILKKEEG